MADRIVSATYLCAVACAGGEGELLGTDGAHLGPVLAALTAAGCEIGWAPNRLQIRRIGASRGFGALRTGPYPAFPTDAQPLLGAVAAGAWGAEPDHRDHFRPPVPLFGRPDRHGSGGANRGDTACFSGRTLHGAQVEATDLRGGAASPWRPWAPGGRAGSTACPTSTGATRGWKGPLRPWAGGFVGKPGKRLDVEHGKGNRYGETRDPNQIP